MKKNKKANADLATNIDKIDALQSKLEQLKKDADAAEQAWIIAHQKIFEEGVYYLQNVATGKFLAAGHDGKDKQPYRRAL